MKLIVRKLSIKRHQLPKQDEGTQVLLSQNRPQGPLDSVPDSVSREHIPITTVIKKTPMGVLKTSTIAPKDALENATYESPKLDVNSDTIGLAETSNSSNVDNELLLSSLLGKSIMRHEKKKLSRLTPPSEKDEYDSDDLTSHSPSRKLEALYKRHHSANNGSGSVSSGDLRGDFRELKKSRRADSQSLRRSSSSLKEGSSSDLLAARRLSIKSTPVLVPYTSNNIRIPQRNGPKHYLLGNIGPSVLSSLKET